MEDNENSQSRQEELRLAIIKYSYKENQQEPFVLASGKKSPYYFDLKQTLLHPQYLWYSARLFFEKMQSIYGAQLPTALGGLTMGADPLVYATSLYAWQQGVSILPVVVRKAGKDHGSKKRAEGKLDDILNGSGRLLLVDDVITTAASTLQAHAVLDGMGVCVDHAMCLIDRQEGGKENLAEHKVELHSIFTLTDFKGAVKKN